MGSVNLAVFGGAAAARNGLTALPVNGNEDYFKINSTNYLVAAKTGYVIAVIPQTAAIANLAQSRLKRTDKNDWMDFGNFGRDQTGAYVPGLPIRMSYPLLPGNQLQAELNNGNNSQVDNIGVFIADSPNEFLSFGTLEDIGTYLAAGYELVRFTGATTVTAGLWTDVTLSAVTWVPDDGALYHCAAFGGWSATGHYGRLKHREGGTQGIRPGFLVGDDASPPVFVLTFQDFGCWKGDSFPVAQHISGAGDTAEEYIALVKKISGGETVGTPGGPPSGSLY